MLSIYETIQYIFTKWMHSFKTPLFRIMEDIVIPNPDHNPPFNPNFIQLSTTFLGVQWFKGSGLHLQQQRWTFSHWMVSSPLLSKWLVQKETSRIETKFAKIICESIFLLLRKNMKLLFLSPTGQEWEEAGSPDCYIASIVKNEFKTKLTLMARVENWKEPEPLIQVSH